MPKLTVVAIITARKGFEEEVKQGLIGLINPTLREKGCINYDLHVDNNDPAVFAFHENWATEEDLDQHLESDHIKKFQEIAEGIVDNVQMHRMTPC